MRSTGRRELGVQASCPHPDAPPAIRSSAQAVAAALMSFRYAHSPCRPMHGGKVVCVA